MGSGWAYCKVTGMWRGDQETEVPGGWKPRYSGRGRGAMRGGHSLKAILCRWRRLEARDSHEESDRPREGGMDSGDVREKESGAQRLFGLGVRGEGSGMKIQTGGYENRN